MSKNAIETIFVSLNLAEFSIESNTFYSPALNFCSKRVRDKRGSVESRPPSVVLRRRRVTVAAEGCRQRERKREKKIISPGILSDRSNSKKTGQNTQINSKSPVIPNKIFSKSNNLQPTTEIGLNSDIHFRYARHFDCE